MTVEYRDETPFTGDNHTPTELANAIRTKKYGKDVREPIAQLADKLDSAIKGQNIGNVVATPTKVFANLSALQSAYPTGADGVMVTVDNGHKYFWQDNDWVDGGEYQTAGSPLNDRSWIYWFDDNIEFKEPSFPLSGFNLNNANFAIYGPSYIDYPKGYIEISAQDIISSALNPKQSLSEEIEKGTFKVSGHTVVGNDYIIYYDITTKQIVTSSWGKYNSMKNGDIPIFGSMYGIPVGLLADAFFKFKFRNEISDNTKYRKHAYIHWWYHIFPNVELVDDNTLEVIFPEKQNGFTLYSEYKNIDIYLSELFEMLESQNGNADISANWNQDTRTLTVVNGMIVLNLESGEMHWEKSGYYLKENEATLLSNNFRNGTGGLAIDDILIQKEISHEKTESRNDIPKYWREHLDDKITEIQKNQVEASLNSLSFLWITDSHWARNDKNSPGLIGEVMKRTNTNIIVHGGDVITGADQESMIKDAMNSLNELSCNYFMPIVLGNHDPNTYGDKLFNYSEMFNLFSSPKSNNNFEFVDYPNSFAWKANFTRKDGVGQKVYAFAFDTYNTSNVTANQIQAFIDLCKQDGYVLVFMHWALDNGAWSGTSQAIDILIDDINSRRNMSTVGKYGDFDLAGVRAKVVMNLSGHEHQDNSRITAGGTPHVVTTCDAGRLQYNESIKYVKGTTTEQAFDVFTIDFDKKTIKEVRIGRGQDRQYTFA